MQGVIPRPDIAPLLQQHFVALASDADDTEDEVIRLAHHLENAFMLPFVIFADAEGKFLDGYAGSTNPPAFKAMIERVIGTTTDRAS